MLITVQKINAVTSHNLCLRSFCSILLWTSNPNGHFICQIKNQKKILKRESWLQHLIPRSSNTDASGWAPAAVFQALGMRLNIWLLVISLNINKWFFTNSTVFLQNHLLHSWEITYTAYATQSLGTLPFCQKKQKNNNCELLFSRTGLDCLKRLSGCTFRYIISCPLPLCITKWIKECKQSWRGM